MPASASKSNKTPPTSASNDPCLFHPLTSHTFKPSTCSLPHVLHKHLEHSGNSSRAPLVLNFDHWEVYWNSRCCQVPVCHCCIHTIYLCKSVYTWRSCPRQHCQWIQRGHSTYRYRMEKQNLVWIDEFFIWLVVPVGHQGCGTHVLFHATNNKHVFYENIVHGVSQQNRPWKSKFTGSETILFLCCGRVSAVAKQLRRTVSLFLWFIALINCIGPTASPLNTSMLFEFFTCRPHMEHPR